MKKGFKFPKVNWKLLLISFLAVYLTALIGSIFTYQNVNSAWYESIRLPITPPNWVFPVVWNILFFLIALSLYFALSSIKNKKLQLNLKIVFGINLLLNALWSFIFFSLQSPTLAFFELIIFWFSITIMIYTTWEINKKSSLLLIPYLLWVNFAGILNYFIAFG
ncbi:MAG: tryptophan-rich sensory protein [Candidatus Nanoarchaeia archaeon]|nr:tryptophan-rich sensory protein [Candidatus Nanoarchaeia archaeon]MDD5357619.1 tryptophan-rich sensory protein [Candidatus Nanoarchaeia archaeon]MDD5588538.1 tryptophan-rich sensory protein [Candidatus Nanoarchaeia archaeon]